MNGTIPSYELEIRAADERKRLHSSVEELKSCMHTKLDLRRNARQYVAIATVAAAVVGLVSGYGFASVFSHR
jgi:hypothetical protein